MIKTYKPILSGICLLTTTAITSNAIATNGMFLIGNSTKSRGMGGASIALPHDTVSSAANPALLAHVDTRFDIGGDITFIDAEASLGQGSNSLTVESKPRHFTISDGVYMLPNMGANWSFGDVSYGFTMVGVGGGGSEYRPNLFNNILGGDLNKPVGVSLLVMNINPTAAIKLDNNNSVGATLIIGVQVFKAFGLEQFTTFTAQQDNTAKFTDQGAEVTYGFGARVGWLGNFLNGKLTLGAAYTSKTYMKPFDKYVDLFAEQGDMDTPGNIGLGLSYQALDDLLIALDINYIMYDQVAAVSNPGPNARASEPFPVDRATNALGRDQGLGFGWSNQTVFKVGAVYQYDPVWTLRAGWNYAKSPIDEEQDILFNTLAPATVQNHLTLGATYKYNKDIEFSFSYIHAFRYRQSGPTYIGYEGSIQMSQNFFGGTFSTRF